MEDEIMILFALCEKGRVYAYDENQDKVLNEQGELVNYTDSTVAIKRDDCVYIYNSKGKHIKTYPKDFIDMSNVGADYVL